MRFIAQEIADLDIEFVSRLAEWNALTPVQRRREWARYTQALDEGQAGWTRYAMLLVNAWCDGFDPTGGMVRDPEIGLMAARAAPA